MRNTLRTMLVTVLVVVGLAPLPARGQPADFREESSLPDASAQLMLIRNTLTLVNHGNLTGNYTVLRDLASESFRRRQSAADLAATFANLRQQKLDLSPILVIEPQLTSPPSEIAPGRLQLVGQFPTRPQAVQFALVFMRVDGGWMIDDISLRVAPVQSAQIPPPRQAAQPVPRVPPGAPQARPQVR